jgi:hypothetical protein
MSTQKLPTLIAYAVKQRDKGRKPIWTKIGAAWPHTNGPGFSVELDANSLDGRLVLVPPKADDTRPEADSASDRFEDGGEE